MSENTDLKKLFVSFIEFENSNEFGNSKIDKDRGIDSFEELKGYFESNIQLQKALKYFDTFSKKINLNIMNMNCVFSDIDLEKYAGSEKLKNFNRIPINKRILLLESIKEPDAIIRLNIMARKTDGFYPDVNNGLKIIMKSIKEVNKKVGQN